MGESIKTKILHLIFIMILCCFFISMRIFYNLGVAADEFNTNPALILGGEIFLTLDWLRLFLEFLLIPLFLLYFYFDKKKS